MRPIRQLLLATMGIHFGFPECCIKEFTADYCETTKRLYPEGPWVGTGFIPCACCAAAALDFPTFVAERITPNRLCSTPFPDQRDNGRTNDIAMTLDRFVGSPQVATWSAQMFIVLDNVLDQTRQRANRRIAAGF